MQLDPDNLDARVDLATFYREAPGIVGGNTRAAVAQFEEIRRRDPYRAALVRGDLALDEHDLGEAERQYRAAVRLNPSSAEAQYRMGILWQRARRYDDAFAAFAKALELEPKDAKAYFQIGKTADLSGQRLEHGEAALKKYLQTRPFFIMPKLAWAHRRLGNIYRKQGRPDAAREQYLAALKLAPEDKEVRTALKELDTSQSR